MRRWSFWLMCAVALVWAVCAVASSPAELKPGQTITVEFPSMPQTFHEQMAKDGKKPMMTVLLPADYDPQRKYPLLVFLNGGDGGTGAALGVARSLSQQKDFICVSLPLFKVNIKDAVIRDEDCKLMWPLYKQMLAKLAEAVPNVDAERRVLGGFSNGAHATGGLIDCSNGEAAKYFSAFFFVEGGGRTQRYDLIKGKPLMICYGFQAGRERVRVRVKEFSTVAIDAGVKVTVHEMKNTGHDFPQAEYPAVRQWLREAVLK